MKKLLLLALADTLIISVVDPASGWDVSLQGSCDTRFAYLGRIGSKIISTPRPNQLANTFDSKRFVPLGLTDQHSLTESSGAPKRPTKRSMSLRGAYSISDSSAVYGGSKLTLSPMLSHRNLFKAAGVFSIGGYGENIGKHWGDGVSGSTFPGSPPFDRYYSGIVERSSGDLVPGAGWEQLWLTVAPHENWEFWVGTRVLPFGVGPTLGSNGSKDIVAISFIDGSNCRVTLGTGASPAAHKPNEDQLQPIPYGPLVLLGYTGGYAAVTAAVAAVSVPIFAITYTVDRLIGAIPSGSRDTEIGLTQNDGFYWERSRHKDRREHCSFTGTALDVLGGWILKGPYTIGAIGHDYAATMGNRKPFHFLTLDYLENSTGAGIGFFWYPNLNRVGRTTSVDPKHTVDQDSAFVWTLYLNYNNGRFFGQGQWSGLAWNVVPAGGEQRYYRGHQWFSDLGGMVGPAKGSVMFALATGRAPDQPDARWEPMHYPMNCQLLEPYEFLMFRTYGGGNQAYGGRPGERQGMMSDAYAWGGRFDFSVAASLNLWVSYIRAHRLNQSGTVFGQYAASGREATEPERAAFAAFSGRSLRAAPSDYGIVSNTYLGYECNIGADWTPWSSVGLRLRGSYWQPGDWFREAHQGVAISQNNESGRATSPAAIVALSGSIELQF